MRTGADGGNLRVQQNVPRCGVWGSDVWARRSLASCLCFTRAAQRVGCHRQPTRALSASHEMKGDKDAVSQMQPPRACDVEARRGFECDGSRSPRWDAPLACPNLQLAGEMAAQACSFRRLGQAQRDPTARARGRLGEASSAMARGGLVGTRLWLVPTYRELRKSRCERDALVGWVKRSATQRRALQTGLTACLNAHAGRCDLARPRARAHVSPSTHL